ncbi:Dolichyl-phosphate-mannose-protein mannosyltransferase [Singulisphaera sp. GP187]|uniref:ArnT family glycosyltransferase n=1 Tax=Singulisphaera sp. GP187 TaxID=1882752 RepID=UPI00092785EA|nr:glycosyltransferase family 39 protein [Singulisphaera sp. GP187]SIN73887.1 Dolichyl-phosphate-mannose-protein mannosyltransferase [Singulisphaera sp. GP187]
MTGSRSEYFSRWGDRLVAGLIAVGALALLWGTLNDYGMAWDEGFTIEREDRLREWFGRITGDSTAASQAWSPRLSKLETRSAYQRNAGLSVWSPWSPASLRFYWQFAREEPNGHPPFYALLGLAGWAVSHSFLAAPGSYRFGPAVLFSLTLGAVYGLMARHYGRSAGLMAALGLLAMPRMFAHAHLASYDAPTLCLWFLAVAAFLQAVESPPTAGSRLWGWTIAFGVAWGCAAATKFTGWFIPFPLVAWAGFYRDRRAARTLIQGGIVAALVVYVLNPTWWADPVGGVGTFLRSNLTRQQLLPIPTLFFGRLYLFSLPWYNTLVLTTIVVPPAILVLALVGGGRLIAGRFRDRVGTLLLGCWAFFMVLRALPNAPGHDGERQFLAAFVFLACLSGIGLATIADGLERYVGGRRLARPLVALVLTGVVGSGAWSTWRYHPLQLSYYNVMIGGLSGATRAGLEPTYYWEAVTPDVRDWLNAQTEKGRTLAFVFPAVTFEYLHHWGLLKPYPLTYRGREARWFVLMNRPGHLQYPGNTLGQYLLDHVKPVYVKALDVAPDVPLIAIYEGKDALEADLDRIRGTEGGPPPKAKTGHPSDSQTK